MTETRQPRRVMIAQDLRSLGLVALARQWEAAIQKLEDNSNVIYLDEYRENLDDKKV